MSFTSENIFIVPVLAAANELPWGKMTLIVKTARRRIEMDLKVFLNI